MWKRWYFSLLMLAVYVTVFVTWKMYATRVSFVVVGSIAIVTLSTALYFAWKASYFATKVDLLLHIYVIGDLCLETVSFELFRLTEPFAVVSEFHNNNNFIGCSLAFTVLLGGYRWFALPKTESLDETAYGQASA